MKSKIFKLAALSLCALAVITAVMVFTDKSCGYDEMKSGQIIALNEIEQLARLGEYDEMSAKADALAETIRQTEMHPSDGRLILLGCICAGFILIIFGYVYYALLRPFDRLKCFAANISRGDFDIPLDYGRTNYFGEFTWAFDSMRREITKAHACEREAIENNKTVIATLSHDIKTPIASIRAYCEGLGANMDTSPEKRRHYVGVIMRKCDEVAGLTNDLFLHSLSDLDMLKIEPERFELCEFTCVVIEDISAERNDIIFTKPNFSALVNVDKNRFSQIVENLINNSRKYAKTDIEISLIRENDAVSLIFRDNGGGIPDEDMPFIFDKFYRGKNCGNEQGSGLGLYIVKYLAEKMGAEISLCNRAGGLEAVIKIPAIF